MTRTNHWQDHWFDLDCEGIPLKEWCTKSTKGPGFAFCRVCKLTLKYLNIGVRALKDHGKSKKHLENFKAHVDSLAVKHSKRKIDLVPSPVIYNKQRISPKSTANIKNGKSGSSKQQPQSPVFPPVIRHVKSPSHQALETILGPVPYYHLCNSELRNGLIPVYPCCYCPEEFESKQLLHEHQVTCIMKPPVLQAVIPSDKGSMRYTSEDEAPPSISPPLKDCPSRTIPDLLSFNSQLTYPSKKDLIAGLGLLPKKKAHQVSQRRRNTECESIDLDEEIPVTPTTPGTTRTPKLLISHLSREGNEHYRRRLSFSVNAEERPEKDKDGVSGTSKDDGDENPGDGRERRVNVGKSLYNLDVTSPLGQFVIKHFKGDPSLHILSDIESHCLTSPPSQKNSSMSRLRVRNAAYPITFRGFSGKSGTNYAHQYKFNKKQVKEFMKTANTGLNKESRQLYRKMKPCKVVLKHVTKADLRYWIPSQNQLTIDLKPLSAAEIAFWTTPKPPPSMESVPVFPNGLKFTSPNVNSVLGLKTRQDRDFKSLRPLSLTLSNFVSEEICAELVQNRKVLYRSLLSDSSKLEDGPFENEKTSKSHSASYSILRHMLNQCPTKCPSPITRPPGICQPFVRLADTCNSSGGNSGSSTFTLGSHLSALNVWKEKETPETDMNKSGARGKSRKRKLPCSDSDDTLPHGKAKKYCKGYSVNVRPSIEGDEIKSFPTRPGKSHAVMRPAQNSDKKDPCKKFPPSVSSLKRVPVNGLSSQMRTLRSSYEVPLRSQGRLNHGKRGKKSVYLREHNQGLQNSNSGRLRPTRRRNMISKNSVKSHLKKELSEQRKTQPQSSKSSLRVILNTPKPHKFTGDKSVPVSQRSDEMKKHKSLKKKLNAAGLVKRVTVSVPPESHVPGKQIKPIVPILTKLAQNLTSTTVDLETRVSNGLVDSRIPPGKSSSQPPVVLRKSKSHSGANFVPETNQQEERCRLKEEKHKNFISWLQSLRKGR